MAESVSILEGGIARKFYPVNKLRTSNGSTYDTWVPENEVEVTSLSVTQRGVYYPANDGVYGYDEVDIDLEVADYTDGWEEEEDPETGETKKKKRKVTSKKDPVTGEDVLVVEELPTSIQITTLPRTVHYVDGQDISIEGIVVHAYYEDGRDWGEVPFEELSFEPTVAEVSEERASSELVPEGFVLAGSHLEAYNNGNVKNWLVWTGDTVVAFLNNGTLNGNGVIICSASPGTGMFGSDQWERPTPHIVTLDQQYTYNGKTVYYWHYAGGYSPDVFTAPVNIRNLPYSTVGSIAWTAIYGTISGSTQEITVSWTPPEGIEPLTDTFEITVSPQPTESEGSSGESSGSNSGGSSGDNWNHNQ